MTSPDRLHRIGPVGRRQFVLSTDSPPPGFVTHRLTSGTLHTCPSLPVRRIEGPSGSERVLLGVATHTSGGDVTQDLARVPTSALARATHHWTGRWVLLDGDEVHMDATGMLSVFYRGRTIASTPALLGGQPSVPPPRREHRMPYLPGPATAVPGVDRLLPSQRLSLIDGQIRSRPLIHPMPVSSAEAPALVDQLGEIMLESVRTAAELGPVVLPLTGGYDSRLILAACVRLGLSPRLVTQAYFGMARSDIDLPQKMGRRLGLPHEVIRRGPRDRQMGKLYDDQVSHLLGEQDRTFLEYQQFGWLNEGDVLLRGIMLDDARGGGPRPTRGHRARSR